MIYIDSLYGSWQLPKVLEKLIKTQAAVRARGINQSNAPNSIMPYGPIPSRFHHGMGVAFLAKEVINHNPDLTSYENLLLASSLLHDAGIPPFSHLAEPFLKEILAKDGESFLEDILIGSDAEKILNQFGLSVKSVVNMVTGNDLPRSLILNGCLDLDNLDNIARYNYHGQLGGKDYNPVKMAASYRFYKNDWVLLEECREKLAVWEDTRKIVYGGVYNQPVINRTSMLYRAIEIIFSENKLSKEFFFLNDDQALEYLKNKGDIRVNYLLDKIWRWQEYEQVYDFVTNSPSVQLLEIATNWKKQKEVVDLLAAELLISPEKIAFYAKKGGDIKNISVKLLSDDGVTIYQNNKKPNYYLKIFLDQEFVYKKNLDKINNFIKNFR